MVESGYHLQRCLFSSETKGEGNFGLGAVLVKRDIAPHYLTTTATTEQPPTRGRWLPNGRRPACIWKVLRRSERIAGPQQSGFDSRPDLWVLKQLTAYSEPYAKIEFAAIGAVAWTEQRTTVLQRQEVLEGVLRA